MELRHAFRLGDVLLMLCVMAGRDVKADQGRPDGSTVEDSLVRATEPGVRVTWPWVAAQLVPSPEWVVPSGTNAVFGFRWQVTPLLYSFGINRRLSPWRTLVAEPIVRYNGSIELFVHPALYFSSGPASDSWAVRSGLRCYFPILRFGEDLAGSIGCAYARQGRDGSVSYEGGVHLFFGIVGLQVGYLPALPHSPWTVTIALRYF